MLLNFQVQISLLTADASSPASPLSAHRGPPQKTAANCHLKSFKRRLSILLLPLFFLSACAKNPVTGGSDLVLVSEQQEIEGMGEKYHPILVKQYGGEYDDPELKQYIVDIGEELAEVSHRSHLIYHFTVLDHPMVNAFAIPGYIYITRGMLAYLNSEAELAAVLGHEMGHITARHSVRQHTKGTLAALLANVVARTSNTPGLADLTHTFGVALVRGYGREHELEADQLGAEYMAKVGYDPEKLIDVLRILKAHEEFEKQLAKEQNRQPNIYHGLFATHPDNDTRLQEIVEATRQFQNSDTVRVGRETYLKKTENMIFGTSSKEGVVKGSEFYHLGLGITFKFPDGWVVRNTPNYLFVHNMEDTLGIVLQLEDRNIRQTPQEFFNKRYKNVIPNSAAPLSASLPGWSGIVKSSRTPYGSRKARIGVLFEGKSVYKFLAFAKETAEFDANDAVFLDVMNSFRPLREDERELARPQRIKLVEVQEGETFSDLAAKSSLAHHAEEIIRLINGMYPDGEPEAGTLLKVVM